MRSRPPPAAGPRRSVARSRHPVTGTVIALVVLLAACGGADPRAVVDPAEMDALREEVVALGERDAARQQRLEDLETTVDRLSRADASGRLTEAERELAQLTETLSVFDGELAAAVTDNEQRDAQTAETTGELAGQNAELLEANEQLRQTVDELRGQLDAAGGRIDRVSGEIEDLGIRYETLRDRLDRAGR